MKVKELLSDKSKWTQGVYARNKDGESVLSCDPQATCYCLSGALARCYVGGSATFWIMYRRIEALLAPNQTIPRFNDKATFEEVKALVEMADV